MRITSKHKKITDNFLSAIYDSFARDVFEKSITKKLLISVSNVVIAIYFKIVCTNWQFFAITVIYNLT